MKDYWRGGACEHSAIIPFISRGIGVEAIFQSNSNLRGNFLRKPHYRRQAVRELSRHERLPLWGYHGQGPGASKGQRGGRSPRREVCACMPGLLPNTSHESISPPTHPTLRNHQVRCEYEYGTDTAQGDKNAKYIVVDIHRPTPSWAHEGGLRATPP